MQLDVQPGLIFSAQTDSMLCWRVQPILTPQAKPNKNLPAATYNGANHVLRSSTYCKAVHALKGTGQAQARRQTLK